MTFFAKPHRLISCKFLSGTVFAPLNLGAPQHNCTKNVFEKKEIHHIHFIICAVKVEEYYYHITS